MSDINPSSMLAVGTVLNGKYRIERHLSSGGFGNTYMATNLTFNDVVAVKEFFMRGISQRDGDSSTISVSNPENRDLFSEQLEKFKKEAQRIRQLRSQHIVRVHDLFEANGTAYYVMDYIDGESLAARLKRTNTPLTEAETRKYLGQVLDALETIHGAGLCHMDLKPENIMVDKADNAVLIDFGASKRSDNERFTSTVSGVSYTNGYAPPEQLEQDTAHFGPWTDIYALGATLYKLLTNRKPPMPSAIYSDPSPDKSSSLPFPMGVSGNLRQVILQMMSVRWNDRPQSVMALRRMLVQPMYDAQTYAIDPYGSPVALGDDTLVQGVQPANEGYVEVEVEPSSRKWLYGVIGFLTVALAVVAFMLLRSGSGTGDEAADIVEKEKTYALSVAELGILNIRSMPSTTSTIIGKMKTFVDEAEVLGKEGDWYKVRFNGVEGYINAPYSFVGTKEQIEEYRNTTRMPTYKQIKALFEWMPVGEIRITEKDLSTLTDFIPKMKYLKSDINNEVWGPEEHGALDEITVFPNYRACYGMNITDVRIKDEGDVFFSTNESRACGIVVSLSFDPSNTQRSVTVYFKEKGDAEAFYKQLKSREKLTFSGDGWVNYESGLGSNQVVKKGDWYVVDIYDAL